MKIAVIEDEKPIREGLVHILNKISPEYQVVGSAENGVEGLILLEEEMPDLIMLDIQMPDMDGLQMLKEARARGIYTKVIILTASREDSDRSLHSQQSSSNSASSFNGPIKPCIFYASLGFTFLLY